jgi:hypothetical protein
VLPQYQTNYQPPAGKIPPLFSRAVKKFGEEITRSYHVAREASSENFRRG